MAAIDKRNCNKSADRIVNAEKLFLWSRRISYSGRMDGAYKFTTRLGFQR